jgi:hypothetical protein
VPIQAIVGERKVVNYQLAEIAAKYRPTLVFDTGNFMNPHKLHPHIPLEQFTQIYVIEIQLLYKFLSALQQHKRIIPEHTKTICVTSFHMLMNYQNDIENNAVLEQCLEILRTLAKTYRVYIGVQPNTKLHQLVKQHAEVHMGHTVWSQRVALDVLSSELKSYAKTLPKHEQKLFNEMLTVPYQKIGSLTYTSSIHVWAFMLMTIMLEQEKRLKALEHELHPDRLLSEQEPHRVMAQNTWQTKLVR